MKKMGFIIFTDYMEGHMKLQKSCKLAIGGLLIFVAVPFSQVSVDSIPKAPGCSNLIRLVYPLCDFNHDGLKDVWVAGAYYYDSGNKYGGIWYGIYSIADKSYLYYKDLGSNSTAANIQEVSANSIDSNTVVTYDGAILSYGSTPAILKKK
jgi:hypothetical protein